MALEEVVNSTSIGLIKEIGQIALWLQAVGVLIIIWMIFMFVNFIINRKRMKEIYHIKSEMDKMDKKLDLLLKRK